MLTLDFSSHEPGLLSLADIEPHLERMREGDLVLICSGNDQNWGQDAYWTGWCYPDPEASRAMIDRGISGIGFDGPSADPVDTTTYELHRIWLSAGRLILENLARLTELGERTAIVVAPMKVRDANGAPARVLAFPDSEGASA